MQEEDEEDSKDKVHQHLSHETHSHSEYGHLMEVVVKHVGIQRWPLPLHHLEVLLASGNLLLLELESHGQVQKLDLSQNELDAVQVELVGQVDDFEQGHKAFDGASARVTQAPVEVVLIHAWIEVLIEVEHLLGCLVHVLFVQAHRRVDDLLEDLAAVDLPDGNVIVGEVVLAGQLAFLDERIRLDPGFGALHDAVVSQA